MGGDQSHQMFGLGCRDRIIRISSPKPKDSATFFGMIDAHLPVRIWEKSTIIELDSSVGFGVTPASAICWLMIRRFCMSA